jgi:hypothetical protein
VIAQQAGALRGDAHASLRLADNALLGSIGNVVQQHQAAMRSGGDADGLASQAAQSVSAQPGMRHGSLFNQLAMHLVEPAGGVLRQPRGGWQPWPVGARFRQPWPHRRRRWRGRPEP